MAPSSSAAPAPMISQITRLTWAARIGTTSTSPSGTSLTSVSTRVTLCTPCCSVVAPSSTVVELSGPISMLSGTRSVIGWSERASRRTVTAWSRLLVIVAGSRPLALDRVTPGGALTSIAPSRSRTSSVAVRAERSAAARAGRVRNEAVG